MSLPKRNLFLMEGRRKHTMSKEWFKNLSYCIDKFDWNNCPKCGAPIQFRPADQFRGYGSDGKAVIHAVGACENHHIVTVKFKITEIEVE